MQTAVVSSPVHFSPQCAHVPSVIIVGKGRLYGTSEIADRLGVTRQRAHVITRQKGFPDTYEDLVMGSVWRIEDVEAWIREHRPELGQDPEGA